MWKGARGAEVGEGHRGSQVIGECSEVEAVTLEGAKEGIEHDEKKERGEGTALLEAPGAFPRARAATLARLPPALATLVMLNAQLDWMLDNGGLDFAVGRSARSAARRQ